MYKKISHQHISQTTRFTFNSRVVIFSFAFRRIASPWAENPPVTVQFPRQRASKSFDGCYVASLDTLLNKQACGRENETS